MKNRAGWLALGVLAIATILMVFFVLPQIGDKQQSRQDDAARQAEPAQTPPAPAAPESAGAKMARLKADAEKQMDTLQSLFADGKTPSSETFAAAKLAAMSALKALADQDVPAGLEAALAESATKARSQAARALALMANLPASPADAVSMIANIGRVLRGEAPAKPEPVKPRFDVLRVEKDGSTVIAGHAAAGARIEVMEGDAVIASTTASQNGDFAIVLDHPLPAGDHALSLRATTADGAVTGSEEQATVSVPQNSQGDVLAMVSKPGEASRLLTVPDQINDAAKQARVPAAPETAPGSAQPAAQAPAPAAAASADGSAPAARIPAQASPDAASTAAPAPAQAQPQTQAQPQAPAANPQLQITAVEVENDKIFVAGNAPKGRSVAAYADNRKIGEAVADDNGKFVVDGTLELSVGQHIISVDLKDANGKITLRLSVPFNRPEGNQMTVVAPPAAPAAASGAAVGQDRAFFDRQRETLAKSFALLTNLFAEGRKPALDALAAARSATQFALKGVADFRPAADGNPEDAAFMKQMAANAAKAMEALKAVPSGSASAMAEALPKIRPLVEAALAPRPASPSAPPAAEMPAIASGTAPSNEPPTISQAPLTASPNTVIIRRGDTLWQISRRVYGQGVRYTTIYMANSEQIDNPDLIEPGQTFAVPDQSLPDSEAEAIHRKWMREHKR
ncbi:Ig-like domain-containing protein [Allorhizobium undicola]|uniref:Ig-like domain-containing protein n=1 Tax=Allorhizobium undicola TaxID=78527 RepID=UPI0009FF62FD|nr:Ig-like domain-containing protein [Allorhizobium undicola]